MVGSLRRQGLFVEIPPSVAGSLGRGRRNWSVTWFLMQTAVRVPLSVACILSLFTIMASGDDDVKQRFMTEYPKALKRLKERYSHIRGSGHETTHIEIRDKHKVTTKRIAFQIDGDRSPVGGPRAFAG